MDGWMDGFFLADGLMRCLDADQKGSRYIYREREHRDV